MLAPLLIACGCLLLVASIPFGSRGAGLRRLALTMIALPFLAALLFGALSRIGAPRGEPNAPLVALGVLLLMVAAYGVIALRERLRSATPDPRVREKRPVDASGRGPDLLALLRDELRREDDE